VLSTKTFSLSATRTFVCILVAYELKVPTSLLNTFATAVAVVMRRGSKVSSSGRLSLWQLKIRGPEVLMDLI